MVFAMANPTPEVTPEEAEPYARIIATGRSRLPEPDQQRPLLPGHLPRRARRPRARDHRGDEDGRRARDRRDRAPTTSCARTTSSRRVFNRDVPTAVAAAVADQAKRAGHRRGRSRLESATRPATPRSSGPSGRERRTRTHHVGGDRPHRLAARRRARRSAATRSRSSAAAAATSAGTRCTAPRPPRRSPAATPSCTSPARTSPSAGTTTTLRRIRESRELGTRNLVAGIARRRPAPDGADLARRAVGYYGHRAASPIDEDAPPGDDVLAEVCEAWEREAATAEELGVRVVRVRTGVVLDRHGGALHEDAAAVPARRRRPGRRRAPADAVDPRRRRRRHLPRRDRRRRAGAARSTPPRPQPGHQPRVLARRSAARCTGPAIVPVPGVRHPRPLRRHGQARASRARTPSRAAPSSSGTATSTPTSTRRCARHAR